MEKSLDISKMHALSTLRQQTRDDKDEKYKTSEASWQKKRKCKILIIYMHQNVHKIDM